MVALHDVLETLGRYGADPELVAGVLRLKRAIRDARGESEGLRERVRVMADWLDVLAAIAYEERGYVMCVVEGIKAADHGRSVADVASGPIAQTARESIEDARGEDEGRRGGQ